MKLLLTGPSGSGKTTIANILKRQLPRCVHLDGDDLRKTLNSDLGFTDRDLLENARRVGELSNWFLDTYQADNIIVSIIAPTELMRSILKHRFGFKVVFINRPECYELDLKGLYKSKQALPYETPINPDLVVDNSVKSQESPQWRANQILMKFLLHY